MLRDYQQDAINMLYDWFRSNASGNPCLVLPTGSGKSHVVAALCKDALQSWPETRVLMLTHQAELIEQNAEKMLLHWPNAPMGVYSASLGRRDLGQPITFAGIGSVRTRAGEIGHVDLVLVDEAHCISGRSEGGYRNLIAGLTEINPRLRVIGLTATPYRLGQGYVTDGEQALFKALIEPVTISHLVNVGHLCELRSKSTDVHYDVSGVRTRAGEFVEKELQAAVSDELTNREAVQEIVARAGDRKSWIIFCTGVDHAKQVAEYLQDLGVTAACVTGETPKKERADILAGFKNGSIKAVTNCNVLTTGFDHTGIDLVALMRPTQSPGLYVQMVGRGLRVNGIKKDALVLDFAENIARHGPITNVNPPRKPGEKGGGVAPVKECPDCAELVHTSVKLCPECGYVWPEPERRYTLAIDDIMGRIPTILTMDVASWKWEKHTSRSSGRDMLKVTYYGHALSDKPVTEYICLGYEGWAGRKAHEAIVSILRNSIPEGVERFAGEQNAEELERLLFSVVDNRGAERFEDISALMNEYATPPCKINYIIDGKYPQIKERIWQ